MGRIRAEYVSTGKVRFVYKHFAILGPESNRAAEASECAAEQGQFWPFHDLVFTDQVASRTSLNQESLVDFAGQRGLDTAVFGECLSSNRFSIQIANETQTVQSLCVRGTPGFLVNGFFISGAQPFGVFQPVV